MQGWKVLHVAKNSKYIEGSNNTALTFAACIYLHTEEVVEAAGTHKHWGQRNGTVTLLVY